MTTPLSPDEAALLFLTPGRTSAQGTHDADMPPARMIPAPSGEVAVWSQGAGRTVLMIHGWEGKRADLAAFGGPLVASGFQVVSLDLPAHGRSGGKTASLPDIAEALKAVAAIVGPVHGIVAHSVGCAASALALQRGLAASHAVFVAPPSSYANFARGFARHAGVDPESMLDAMRRLDIDIDSIDMASMAPRLSARALIIHSQDDKVVPFANGQAIAAAWPGARLLACEGLGHGRILVDRAVVAAAVEFLNS